MEVSLTIYHRIRDVVREAFAHLHLENRTHPKGRKPLIDNIDAVSIAIMKQRQNVATKKSLHEIIEPPCSYKTFVVTINRTLQTLGHIILAIIALLRKGAHWLKFGDSTDLPVCLYKNAGSNRTMAGLSGFSKTGKGPFFGLKLHLSADVEGRVLGIQFTPGNSDDRAMFQKMNEKLKGLFVLDAGYLGKDFTREFFKEGERAVITAVRSNMRKVATFWQLDLLDLRMRIEIHFRILKCIYGLVTSFPRSIDGYLTHYLATVLCHLLSPKIA